MDNINESNLGRYNLSYSGIPLFPIPCGPEAYPHQFEKGYRERISEEKEAVVTP